MDLINTKITFEFDDGKRHYYSLGENCFASSVARFLANEERERSRSCFDYAVTDVGKNLYELRHKSKDFTVQNLYPNVFGKSGEYCVAMKNGDLYCHFKPEHGTLKDYINRMESSFKEMCENQNAYWIVSFAWYDEMDTMHIDNVLPMLLAMDNVICCVPMEYPNNRNYNLDGDRIIRYAFKKGDFEDTTTELWKLLVGKRRY